GARCQVVSLTVAYIALGCGILVWVLLVRKLSAKPWEAQAASAATAPEQPATAPARIGLWVFLAIVTSLFGLFLSAYYMRMGAHGTAGTSDWVALEEPTVLWLNTALLILSSIAMQSARAAAMRGQLDRTWAAMLIGGLLTLAFLAGQFYAWGEIRNSAFFSPRNPALAFFYMLTAVHGLHLLGGLYVWGRTLARMRRKDIELIDVSLSVQLCAVYWHFLLFVWLALFVVMLST
ncbi:MAG: cytochrome c oxidase subunit 3, partial [Steroidobacteraceae bacterium]